jgi:hypothetical protein
VAIECTIGRETSGGDLPVMAKDFLPKSAQNAARSALLYDNIQQKLGLNTLFAK